MKKTTLFLLLCLTLILALAPSALASELPSVGDEISGFVVTSVEPFEALGATSVLFEHEHSGAQLLYLASEDTNRSFDITFRTPALDDTGKAHVFEHMTICGSQKYPDPNMFFSFANQTYNTYVNACTYHGMTSYPLASLSEDQLMTMMDYYLSGVFEPLVYTEPRMVQREAWRYELSDADAPLSIAGTVYSEMQGANTIAAQAANNNNAAAFKDGLTAHVSGGTVEAIPTLTQQSLIDFHDAYYQPSNALIILYGKLDYQRFMSFIDTEYLSRYEKSDVYVEMGRVEPYTETHYATYDFPVEEGASTDGGSYIHYSFVLPDAGLEEYYRMSVLSSVISQESSPLMIALREALPSANISIGVDMDVPAPTFTFAATGVNESDRDLFVKTVDESLAKMAAEGLRQDDLDAVLAATKLSLLLTGENADLGVNASLSIALSWTYFGRTDMYNVFEKAINEATADTVRETLTSALLDNAYRSVSVTRPVAGLAEQNAAALEKELADVKSGMSAEEIDAMVKQAEEFTQWSSAAVDPEIIAPLLNVTPDTLPTELVHYDVKDETRDGVRYATCAAQLSGVVDAMLMLDGSAIPAQQLGDVNMVLSLLGELPTERYTREELDSKINRYLCGFMSGLSAVPSVADIDDVSYSATFSYMVLEEDMPEAAALLEEVLLHSDFTDTQTIRQVVERSVSSYEQSFDGNVLSAQMSRLAATLGAAYGYNAYVSGIDDYEYMRALLTLDDATLSERLVSACELVFNRHGAIVACAGDEKLLQGACDEMDTLLQKMPDEAREPVDYSSLCKQIGWDAVTVNSTVQMNMLLAPAKGYTGKDTVIAALINDTYLLPQLRNAYGAYGAYSVFSPFYDMLYTYRDPNLQQTFDIFEALPEYLRTADITQELVDAYIVGSYSGLSRPQGALSGALTAISSLFNGQSEELRLQWMEQAKQTTVDDVRAAADRLENAIQTGARSTSATASTIEENKELFTSVIKLGGAE